MEHKTYSPIEIAARFHHRLVKIHPFPNGNGRHARIMADVILKFVFEEPAIDWAGGVDLQKMSERRDQYIASLRAADVYDYTLLLQFAGSNKGKACK